jgi:hypothetical protein
VVGVSDREERLVADIPSELKRLVKSDSRTIKEVVTAALWSEYGGKRDGALERQIRENQDRAAQAAHEIDNRIEEIHGYARENHQLRQQLDGQEERQREYAVELLSKRHGDVPAANNPSVTNYAGKADMDPHAFVDLMDEVKDDA